MDMSVDVQIRQKGKNAPGWKLDSDPSGIKTLEQLFSYTRNALMAISAEVLKREQMAGRFPKSGFTVLVDGKRNKPIDKVDPLGKIQFLQKSKLTTGTLKISSIYNRILENSPVLSGQYRDSHWVFLNGKMIADNMNSLLAWEANSTPPVKGDIVRIVNVMPYAGKLERMGITATRRKTLTAISKDRRRYNSREERAQNSEGKFIVSKPNGVYFMIAKSLARSLKSDVRASFEFSSGKMLGISGITFVSRRTGKPMRNSFVPGRKRYKGPYAYPTIVLRVIGTNIKE